MLHLVGLQRKDDDSEMVSAGRWKRSRLKASSFYRHERRHTPWYCFSHIIFHHVCRGMKSLFEVFKMPRLKHFGKEFPPGGNRSGAARDLSKKLARLVLRIGKKYISCTNNNTCITNFKSRGHVRDIFLFKMFYRMCKEGHGPGGI